MKKEFKNCGAEKNVNFWKIDQNTEHFHSLKDKQRLELIQYLDDTFKLK